MPAGPGLPAGPGQAAAAALGQEVTITELAREGGLRAIGLRPGTAASGPSRQAGDVAPGYQPTSGYQAGGAGSGYQAGAPSGYQPGAPSGYQPGAPSGPPGWTNPLLPDAAGYPPGGPRRRRGKGLPIFVGGLVVLALAAAAFVVLHLGNGLLGGHSTPSQTATTVTTSPSSRSGSPSPTTSSPQQSSAPPATPAAAVTAYFNAINNHQYRTAWNIDQYEHSFKNFTTFRQGFAGTQYDQLTIVSVSGDVVTIQLAAHQTDGTVNNYSGTYTVQNGVFTRSNIQPG
jgi:hypothetical protein